MCSPEYPEERFWDWLYIRVRALKWWIEDLLKVRSLKHFKWLKYVATGEYY